MPDNILHICFSHFSVQVCDGYSDCADASDESNCNAMQAAVESTSSIDYDDDGDVMTANDETIDDYEICSDANEQ